jgi:hypothetical protein
LPTIDAGRPPLPHESFRVVLCLNFISLQCSWSKSTKTNKNYCRNNHHHRHNRLFVGLSVSKRCVAVFSTCRGLR